MSREPARNDDLASVSGSVRDVQYHGATSRIEIEMEGGGRIVASVQNSDNGVAALPAVGDAVQASWSRAAMVPLEDAP